MYRSPPGPTVLPNEPCRPDTNRDALGSGAGRAAPTKVGVRTTATSAAKRGKKLRREPITGPPESRPFVYATTSALGLCNPDRGQRTTRPVLCRRFVPSV